MPHVPGHIQNSKKRIGKPLKHKGGVLYPQQAGAKLDLPIIFFVGDPTAPTLTYGHAIAFHPILFEFGTSKFVIAGNVFDHAKHEAAEDVVTAYLAAHPNTPRIPNPSPLMDELETIEPGSRQAIADQCTDAELKSILNTEIDYLTSKHYKKMYFQGGNRIAIDDVIQWIYVNAVPFEDINLATN